MVSYRKVHAAISSKIEEFIPDIPIQTTEVEEGFKRPCFSIEITNVDVDNLMGQFEESKIAFEILYFPKERKKNQIDILDKMDLLKKAFIQKDKITIDKDFIAEVENIELFTVDKVLHLNFEIQLSEQYPIEEKEFMEELMVKGGLNGNK